MPNDTDFLKSEIKNWWILSLIGLIVVGFGLYILMVMRDEPEPYYTMTMLFGGLLFISGLFEIAFAASNYKMFKGWGLLMTSGIFDIILGIVLSTNEEITAKLLPFILGIWLVYRGITQISHAIMLRHFSSAHWGWMVIGGLVTIALAFLVIYYPAFAGFTVVMWTAFGVITIGIFTFLLSFLLKRINTMMNE